MPSFSAFQGLPFADQMLHGLHFMLCAFSVLVACIPLLTPKGSPEHKFGGMIYMPIALAALLLASYVAWREASLVLFCFNSFCAYLLLGGWRAVHEKEKPELIDWAIPTSLLALSVGVTLHALIYDEGMRSFYLLFFALNGFYLAARDWRHLRRRAYIQKHKIFLVDASFGTAPTGWINRHIAGMAGSVMANLSVVVLTILPISLHWLWPASLIGLACIISWRERQKKARLRAAFPTGLQAKFAPGSGRVKRGDDIRRAA
jgi:hypothetical protein